MYQSIDTTHVGATGHSEGGFATTTAGADSHITTIAPICGAMSQRNLHGPVILFCGGQDTPVSYDTMIQPAFAAITNQPAMLAEYLTADHGNRMTFGNSFQSDRSRSCRVGARAADGRHYATPDGSRLKLHAMPGLGLEDHAEQHDESVRTARERREVPNRAEYGAVL